MYLTPEQQLLIMVAPILLWLAIKYRHRGWSPSRNAHGTAYWATLGNLLRAGMLSGKGLVLGRTLRKGKLLHMNRYCHVQCVAPTGAGKGVSFVIPTLLTYTRGSVFIFDPKGELVRETLKARQRFGRVIVIDPFHLTPYESDCFNPLAEISPDDPCMIDEARAMAEAIVVRPNDGDEKDPHWSNSAVMLITAAIVANLILMREEERNYSSVREFMTDPVLFAEFIKRLQANGGIPARLGNQLAKQAESEKEMAGVISTANTHTSFIDSELIQAVLKKSTFSADVLLKPGTSIYLVLPVEQLDAQRNFLRLIVTSLLRHVMRHGAERGGETLFLLDECASLSGLDALSQAFQLGRGKGVRLYTFWQSVDQAQAAFKKTPNLVSDNSDAQIYFGVNSYATADLVSKCLGQWTMATETANVSESGSSSVSPSNQGTGRSYQKSWSSSRNYQEIARPLLHPSEILRLNGILFIALIRGVPPILGKRIKYYSDPLFTKSVLPFWWVLILVAAALCVWGAMSS